MSVLFYWCFVPFLQQCLAGKCASGVEHASVTSLLVCVGVPIDFCVLQALEGPPSLKVWKGRCQHEPVWGREGKDIGKDSYLLPVKVIFGLFNRSQSLILGQVGHNTAPKKKKPSTSLHFVLKAQNLVYTLGLSNQGRNACFIVLLSSRGLPRRVC